ncbi:hypothetical protein BFP71_14205 [Roseivirga misakiensis]|uniref:MerC mercury resistance protein n=1 Tax=Roseivirga misakiensis TaxID=1563681 RepID=A0A1E5T2I9_9BACT|nr:hypothetical protein BFP71_14205 [Roseivirga misakiensis]
MQTLPKPDLIGSLVSTLCAIHCMITPFIFIAKAGTEIGSIEPPFWYRTFDYLFVAISLLAVYFATQNSSKSWIKVAMWATFSLLFLAIMNESFEISHLPEASVYVPALILAGLHIYNKKYCQCQDETCCTTNT